MDKGSDRSHCFRGGREEGVFSTGAHIWSPAETYLVALCQPVRKSIRGHTSPLTFRHTLPHLPLFHCVTRQNFLFAVTQRTSRHHTATAAARTCCTARTCQFLPRRHGGFFFCDCVRRTRGCAHYHINRGTVARPLGALPPLTTPFLRAHGAARRLYHLSPQTWWTVSRYVDSSLRATSRRYYPTAARTAGCARCTPRRTREHYTGRTRVLRRKHAAACTAHYTSPSLDVYPTVI